MPIRVVPVPALEDNYMRVIDEETKQCGVVDPVDASAIQTAAEREGATITAILTTHSHWDHAGGNVELKKRCASVEVVYGGGVTASLAARRELNDGDTFALRQLDGAVPLDAVPHGRGHICYLVDGNVFTGDTMFVSGCGNFNSGTPAQMASAFQKALGLTGRDEGLGRPRYTQELQVRFVRRAGQRGDPAKVEMGRVVPLVDRALAQIGDEKRCNPFRAPGAAPHVRKRDGRRSTDRARTSRRAGRQGRPSTIGG